jgi:hypothetical protein
MTPPDLTRWAAAAIVGLPAAVAMAAIYAWVVL